MRVNRKAYVIQRYLNTWQGVVVETLQEDSSFALATNKPMRFATRDEAYYSALMYQHLSPSGDWFVVGPRGGKYPV